MITLDQPTHSWEKCRACDAKAIVSLSLQRENYPASEATRLCVTCVQKLAGMLIA